MVVDFPAPFGPRKPVTVLALWAVQGLTALQRSRLHTTLGVDIPARSGAAERRPWPIGPWLAAATWRQLGFHLLSILTGVGGGGLVAASWLAPVAVLAYLAAGRPPAAAGVAAVVLAAGLLLAAPWLARLVTRADEALAWALPPTGIDHRRVLAVLKYLAPNSATSGHVGPEEVTRVPGTIVLRTIM
jgi:hypothetical protein